MMELSDGGKKNEINGGGKNGAMAGFCLLFSDTITIEGVELL